MLMPKKVKYRKQQKGKRRGKAWRGSARLGWAWHGRARQGKEPGKAWRGAARLGAARQGMARQGSRAKRTAMKQ